MLEIKNLTVKKDERIVLSDINLKVPSGKKIALFGPNGSGKSTLANVILGLFNYKIEKGRIFFKKVDITNLSPEKRVKFGLALSFQHPPAIEGLKLNDLLREIDKEYKEGSFEKYSYIIKKDLNRNISGGEKKISELLQIVSLKPDLAILDEIDSGLDAEKLKELSWVINEKILKNKKSSLFFISHNGNLLEYLKPDIIYILMGGKIICSSKDWKKVWRTIKKYGYQKCKKCQLSSNR